METKQVIVIRKDLKMRKGKMIAQGAHVSLKAVLDYMIDLKGREDIKILSMRPDEAMYHWINGTFTKIVVGVNSEKEMIDLEIKAKAEGLITAAIWDIGKTEFHGVTTLTALAIGPGPIDDIDTITGHLKLL